MGAGYQTGCVRTCHLSESYLPVLGVPYHAICIPTYHHRVPTSLNSPLLTCRFHGFMAVSIPVHVHQLDSIGNENRQTSSSHQQTIVGVDEPRRGVKLCVVQSTRVHEWGLWLRNPISIMFR
ncbi:uncharacterized protein TNCV_2553431 [Trichonephila clavipes]|nr:uncharacterized protein TNCV_2553431 [Trichonephila clavipes]